MTLRLNLGAGNDRREGFVSVDLRADVADIKASVDELPYETGTVDELLALDVLEHFWRDDAPVVLAEWRRVLRPGGHLTLRVPNIAKLAVQFLEADAEGRDLLAENTLENLYGAHRWGPAGSWDTHHWAYTPRTLVRLLEANGFVVLSNDERHNMTLLTERMP